VTTVDPATTERAEPLQRLHPLSPFVRGIRVFGIFAVILTYQGGTRLDLWQLFVLAFVVVVVTFAGSYVSYRFTGYQVAGRELRIAEGILNRRVRTVPLERVQAVDVVRPLLARLLGLAEVRLEVVGRGSTEAPLAYLAVADALRLRDRLLGLAARADGPAEVERPAVRETVLHRVATRDLVMSQLLRTEGLLLPLSALLTIAFGLWDFRASLAGSFAFLSVLFGIGQNAVRHFLGEYGFTVAVSDDGLVLRSGLLSTRSQTVPPGRVQAVRIVRPLLWRPVGWVRVELDVAGYGATEGEQVRTNALLPVADPATARQVLGLVLPGVDVEAVPLVPAGRTVRWRAPLQARRLAAGLGPLVVVTRAGWLVEETVVAPYARTQSVRVVEGPWQRRLGLASVHVDTAGRRFHPVAHHRDRRDAGLLAAALVARADAARRTVAAAPGPGGEPGAAAEPPSPTPLAGGPAAG